MHRTRGARRSVDLSSGPGLRRRRWVAIRRTISCGSQNGLGVSRGDSVFVGKANGSAIKRHRTALPPATVIGTSSHLRRTNVLGPLIRNARSISARSSRAGASGSLSLRFDPCRPGRLSRSEMTFRSSSYSRYREFASVRTMSGARMHFAHWSRGRAADRPTTPKNTAR